MINRDKSGKGLVLFAFVFIFGFLFFFQPNSVSAWCPGFDRCETVSYSTSLNVSQTILTVSGFIRGGLTSLPPAMGCTRECNPVSSADINWQILSTSLSGLEYANMTAMGSQGTVGSGMCPITEFSYSEFDFNFNIDVSSLPSGNYTLSLVESGICTQAPATTYDFTIIRCSASLTCDSADSLVWNTSNCVSRSIDQGIGAVGAAGSVPGTAGTTYTLTADTLTRSAFCPALPTHMACNASNQCLPVAGAGVDLCANDSECTRWGNISASPNPIVTCNAVGTTTITSSSNVDYCVYANASVFACHNSDGGATHNDATGNWVDDGMVFYLNAQSDNKTLASTTVNLNCIATHKECDGSNQCIVVIGAGSDSCTSDPDCVPPTHKACNASSQCVSVAGAGSDACSIDANCTHKECNASNQCVSYPGAGSDLCAIDPNCATPDFSISAAAFNPSSISPGSSSTSNITLASLNGFSGNVNINVSSCPISFVSCSLSTNTVWVPSGGSASATLTAVTGTSTPAITYTVAVVGTSGVLSHQTNAFLTVTTGSCTTLTYQSVTSGFTLNSNGSGLSSSLSVSPGAIFYLFVDYGQVNDAIIPPSSGGNTCGFDNFWLGTAARFICTASSTPNPYSYTTGTASGTLSNICASGPQTIGNLTVGVSIPCPAAPPSPYPLGFWDRIWCDRTFTTKLADVPEENNEQFDNSWGNGVVAGIRADDIGFRSGKTINFPVAGTYTFTVGNDDGIRVWIDGVLVLDDWSDQGYLPVNTFTRVMTAGNHQVRIDYYENAGDARVSFGFSSPNNPPSTPSGVAGPGAWSYCSGLGATVGWNYSDPEGDNQSAYRVQITDYLVDPTFSNPKWDTGKTANVISSGSLGSNSTSGLCSLANPTGLNICRMTWNTRYRARVMVWDSNDNASSWSAPSTDWLTPPYAYPNPANFTTNPVILPTIINSAIQFTDTTTYNPGGTWMREWTITDPFGGTITQSVSPINPTFSANGIWMVSLLAYKDGDKSYSCTPKTLMVPIAVPIPSWREVPPK